MRFVGRWLGASLLALIAGCANAAPPKASESTTTPPMGEADAAWRQAVTVLLRQADGQRLGSGVVAAKAAGGLWIASNRHVVLNQSTVCVVRSDRTAAAALVMPLRQRQKQRKLDLALIWLPLPAAPQAAAVVANASEELLAAQDFPVVVATGFPTQLGQTALDGPIYSERPGLLVPLLKEPLQDGLDLAYTSVVEKGMSGGGVFLGRQLVGINSAHREPLWPGHWRDAKGEAVPEQLNQKLDLVSLGLSSKQIKQAIKAAATPKGNDLNRLVGVECSQPVLPAQPARPMASPSTQ